MDYSGKQMIINDIPKEVDYKSFSEELLSDLDKYYDDSMEWFERTYKNIIKHNNENKQRQFIIYVIDNKVVGISLLKLTKDDQKISTLYVQKEYRRQGIGTALVRKSLEIFNKDYKSPTLFFNDKVLCGFPFFPYFLSKEGFECKSRNNSYYFYVK